VLLAFFGILLLSNVIAALSTFFLADDLELIRGAPVDGFRVYAARLLETALQSSWMVGLMLVPILASYAVAFGAGPLFALVSLAALAAFFAIPAAIGAAVTLVLVNVFPARRARDLLALIGLFGIAAVIVALRMVRPERLASPEGFGSLVAFVSALEAPSAAWLPSEWAASSILATVADRPDWFPFALLLATAAALFVLGATLHGRLYAEGFSRAQGGARLQDHARRGGLAAWDVGPLRAVSPPVRALVAKDGRTFFRDTTQWSQLALLGVLVVVYVYNIRALPLFTGERVSFTLTHAVAFVNVGVAGFVLSAIAARFLFPAVSLEGRHLWLLKSAPLDLRRLVWTKYATGVIPLLLLAIGLTVATNLILRVGPLMMVLAVATIVAITLAVSALALGIGASHPRFETANAAEISTGYGGFLFMMLAVAYLAAVVVLEAFPVLALLRAGRRGLAVGPGELLPVVGGLGGAALLSLAVTTYGLRTAVRAIGEIER
jgi:ABC-2 type transport system permease protein